MPKTTSAIMTTEREDFYTEVYNALSQNTDVLKQKIKVLNLSEVQGKQKIDKKTNEPVVDPVTGEPEYWDASYYLTYVALNSGGEHRIRITQSQYLSLMDGGLNSVYVAEGSIKYILYPESYSTTAVINFEKFIPAKDLFVTAMLKLEQLKNVGNA